MIFRDADGHPLPERTMGALVVVVVAPRVDLGRRVRQRQGLMHVQALVAQ